jgi:glycosyltransferase involved in cell wall biosynthesis
MRILWISWKDLKNPLAGGAEVVSDQIMQRMVAMGHEVLLLTAGYPGSVDTEKMNGYSVIRVGTKWTVYLKAFTYARKHLQDFPDLVIEEINTIPFYAQLHGYSRAKITLWFHQLCREIWFYQMFFPVNIIGYLLEPFYVWGLRKNTVLTISQSTKKDLLRFGFNSEKITVAGLGITMEPVDDLNQIHKNEQFTVLSLGAVREMKRTLDQVKAFEIAHQQHPDMQMIIAGNVSGKYGEALQAYVHNSAHRSAIHIKGPVSHEEKIALMRSAHVITVTSVKEGWGLIVTEANSQGTPAVVYNIDGLRDAANLGQSNMVTQHNTPASLADSLLLLAKDTKQWKEWQEKGWRHAQTVTFEQSFHAVTQHLEL